MRVSTKTVSGFGILLGLACISLAYQVSVLHQMQSINRDLSAVNLRSASSALRTMQLSDTLEEFARKYFVAADPIYERQMEEVQQEFTSTIVDMRTSVRSNHERSEVERMAATFEEFRKAFAGHKTQIKQRPHR